VADLFLALLHHPVLDKNGAIVTTALTNMDIHDIARSACTYGVRRFFVVTPVRALRALADKIIEHWETGFGSTYNTTRKEALALVSIEPTLDDVLIAIERACGAPPTIVATSARPAEQTMPFSELQDRLRREAGPYLILFGTGWGLAPELLERAHLRLEPVVGPTAYNHLSVRSAAAIILDRLFGTR